MPRDACGLGAGNHIGQFPVESGKIQVAMTVVIGGMSRVLSVMPGVCLLSCVGYRGAGSPILNRGSGQLRQGSRLTAIVTRNGADVVGGLCPRPSLCRCGDKSGCRNSGLVRGGGGFQAGGQGPVAAPVAASADQQA